MRSPDKDYVWKCSDATDGEQQNALTEDAAILWGKQTLIAMEEPPILKEFLNEKPADGKYHSGA